MHNVKIRQQPVFFSFLLYSPPFRASLIHGIAFHRPSCFLPLLRVIFETKLLVMRLHKLSYQQKAPRFPISSREDLRRSVLKIANNHVRDAGCGSHTSRRLAGEIICTPPNFSLPIQLIVRFVLQTDMLLGPIRIVS